MQAYAAVVGDHCFEVGLAQEGEPGYFPKPEFGAFPTWERAQAFADQLNRMMFRLEPMEAALVVASSMRPAKRGQA